MGEDEPFLTRFGGNDEDVQESGVPGLVAKRTRKKSCCICLCLLVSVVAAILLFGSGLLVGHYAIPNTGAGQAPKPNYTDEICANPPVLLISLDGFWNGYFQRNITPFLQNLSSDGVKAEYMRSAYPTKTFPNHFTIVTGRYPESHGIVGNAFYDSKLNKLFYIGSRNQNDVEWWRGEPVWVTANKSGYVTGVYFWPGSEAPIQGINPTYYFKYDGSVTYEQRVKTVLEWLDRPKDTRPQFMALYFDEPDHSGHEGGPFSDLVNQALVRVDKTIQSLFQGLETRGLSNCVNVFIISDHGMGTFNTSFLVNLPDLISPGLAPHVKYGSYGVSADISAVGGGEFKKQIYDALVENGTSVGAPFRAYFKEDIPLRLHAGHYNKERYGDIYAVGNLGSYIIYKPKDNIYIGEHGYDNIWEEMHAIFIGHGPAFKKNYSSQPFDNIQLYNLMCALLGISPAANNGTFGSLYHLLNSSIVSKLPPAVTPGGVPGNVNSCPFPVNDGSYDKRSFCSECVCEELCLDVANSTINESNSGLNITSEQADTYLSTHLPWGRPTGGEGDDSCLLVQEDYITLYSNTLRIPLWSAYRITIGQTRTSTSSCFRRDPRLVPDSSANCTSFNDSSQASFLPVRLVSRLSERDSRELSTSLLTNVVPQMVGFNKRVWLPFQDLLRRWLVEHGTLHVISGSVLDANKDGLRDQDSEYSMWMNGNGSVAVPSHFFTVVVRCLNTNGGDTDHCSVNNIDAVGFLFQHPIATGDPSDTAKLLRFSLTPLRDIEGVTGTNFFPDLSIEDQNRIELSLTNTLWSGLIPNDLKVL